MRRFPPVLLALLLIPALARAATVHVPGDQPTIQAGIDAAFDGDTVLLAARVFTGTGNWNLDFSGKAITVRSVSGDPTECTIDLGGHYAHRGFAFHSGESSDSRVEGITIADGYHSHGAGMWIENSSPTVVACRILRCVSQSDGGGVDCTNGASPVFRGCILADNEAYFYGGGIRLELGTSAELSACTLIGNTAERGGGLYSYGGTATLLGSSFIANSAHDDGGGVCLHGDDGDCLDCSFVLNVAETGFGGAVLCSNSSPRFDHCTFWGNAADVAGGIHCRIASSPQIGHTIIASSKKGCAVFCADVGYEPVLSCCDIYGNEGGDWIDFLADQYGVNGNISVDPLFCDPDNGDFHLDCMSPCAPDYNPECGLIGALGVGCGPTAAVPGTWGMVKSLFDLRGE